MPSTRDATRPATGGDAAPRSSAIEQVLSEVRQLRTLLSPERSGPQAGVSIRAVQKAVAQRFGVDVADLAGADRSAAITKARHVAFYLARAVGGCSLTEIGRNFGGRHHGTVLRGCRRIADAIGRSPGLAASVQAVRAAIACGQRTKKSRQTDCQDRKDHDHATRTTSECGADAARRR
jgi:hypothetical protein